MNIRNIWDKMSAIDDPMQEGHTCLVSIDHIQHKYLIHGLIDLLVTCLLPLSLQMIWYFWVEWVLNDYCWNSCCLSLWYLASNQSVMDFRPHAMLLDFCYMDHRLMRLSYFSLPLLLPAFFSSFFLLSSSFFLFLLFLLFFSFFLVWKVMVQKMRKRWWWWPQVLVTFLATFLHVSSFNTLYVQKCMPMIDDYVSFVYFAILSLLLLFFFFFPLFLFLRNKKWQIDTDQKLKYDLWRCNLSCCWYITNSSFSFIHSNTRDSSLFLLFFLSFSSSFPELKT